ncbi:hypothetical protein PAXRUDRAFT_147714 [Paxillus rubicundulus Ve08.2h10]|uniref:Uncharacterized protein n=1 Tax=Paxillus rubicundulus Ve08.2h10 TaxID=930991 RepID=A0A0D0DLN2_9AGAM|nr:hypothetical protein PAXRUDRAFT_147714 [Paxillus rubicundulus Ve08.2h10]
MDLLPAPAPAPAPVHPQPPSLERPVPAQIIAGVQESNQQHSDRNWDYQQTLNEDAA